MTALPRLCLLQKPGPTTAGACVQTDDRTDALGTVVRTHRGTGWCQGRCLRSFCVVGSVARAHALARSLFLASWGPAGRHPEPSSHQRATQVAVLVRRAQHVDLCAELRYQSDRAADCFVRQFCFTTRGHPGVRSVEQQQQPRPAAAATARGSVARAELVSFSFFGCRKF